MYGCRCNERLKTKTEGSTRLGDEVKRREVSEFDGECLDLYTVGVPDGP